MRRLCAPVFVLSLIALPSCTGSTAAGDTGVVDAAGSDAAVIDGALVDTGSGSDANAGTDAATLGDAGDAGSLADGGDATTAGTCDASIAAIAAALPDVLFLSESDRVISLLVFSGEGNVAPTLDHVLALAAPLPAGATSEVRTTDRYLNAFEPASASAPATAPMALADAVNAALTDLIYVAIHDPDPAHAAEVRVILAGRTACGQLVWLESISIET
jgi:hypothetical protein